MAASRDMRARAKLLALKPAILAALRAIEELERDEDDARPMNDVDRALRAVKRVDVRDWFLRVNARVARSTALNALNVLRVVFRHAVAHDVLRDNPAHGVELPRAVQTDDDWTFLTPAEQTVFLAAVREPDRYLFQFAIGTDLRAGELAALVDGPYGGATALVAAALVVGAVGLQWSIRRDGKRVVVLAHRHAYEMFVGEIPEGIDVLHRCDTPRCVNVEHLFLGTHADNMRDMVAKGRWRSPWPSRRYGHVQAAYNKGQPK